MNLDTFKSNTVEQIIDFIALNSFSKDRLLLKINQSKLSSGDKEALLKKIDTSYNRINEPLELSLKLFYLFVPFGLVNLFVNSKDLNFKRFQEYRYLKKIKQYYTFSAIGMITYILIGIIAGLVSRYYS